MDPKRRGEIAYELLKVIVSHELSLANIGDIRRRAGNFAEKAGIPLEEVLAFDEEIIREVFEEQMAKGFKPKATETTQPEREVPSQ